jgi:plasmid maintenance system antidote protein VapI
MLREEFLEPLGMTQVEPAQSIRVPYVRVSELVNPMCRFSDEQLGEL